MKIAILGDPHFGIRQGAKSFNAYFEKFYSNIFFPYLINNNIKIVFCMGDLFDDRKATNIKGLAYCKQYFFSKFDEYEIDLISLVGNHDTTYKNTLEVNSPSLLLNEYKKIKIISAPTLYSLNDINLLLLPWICEQNYEQTLQMIDSSSVEICMGHLELRNFAMYKGINADDGMEADIFSKFEYVFSGHYHHKSNRGNIYYVGTPTEQTWNDYGDEKGFHIFDFDTKYLEFISNPYKMFNKIYYDDVNNESELKEHCIDSSVLSQYNNTYVKLIIKNKTNLNLFDSYFDMLTKVDPIDISIIEDMSEILSEEMQDINDAEDTFTILLNYIDSIKPKDLETNKIHKIFNSIYEEALSLEGE